MDTMKQSERRSSASSDMGTTPNANVVTYLDICGRHRKQVELNRLNKEISLLEEELKTLEGLPFASKCCKEVVETVKKRPDPLLPFVTKGQSTPSWDRWFKERSADSGCCCGCSCRLLKIWKFSHWKRITCWKPTFRKASCLIPRFSCCKHCSFRCHCMRFMDCCTICTKK